MKIVGIVFYIQKGSNCPPCTRSNSLKFKFQDLDEGTLTFFFFFNNAYDYLLISPFTWRRKRKQKAENGRAKTLRPALGSASAAVAWATSLLGFSAAHGHAHRILKWKQPTEVYLGVAACSKFLPTPLGSCRDTDNGSRNPSLFPSLGLGPWSGGRPSPGALAGACLSFLRLPEMYSRTHGCSHS